MTEDSEDVTPRVTEDEVVELVEKLYGLKVSNFSMRYVYRHYVCSC